MMATMPMATPVASWQAAQLQHILAQQQQHHHTAAAAIMHQQQQQPPPPPVVATAVHSPASYPQQSSLQAQQPNQPATAMVDEEPEVAHAPPQHGYAKLIGKDFSYVLRVKHLQLGRRMPTDRPGLLGISAAKNVSRVHAEIAYDTNLHQWTMICLGKNGMTKNHSFIPSSQRIEIKHKDRLAIGETVFFFLEPIPMSQSMVRTSRKRPREE